MRTKYVLLLAAFIATVCATIARADIPIVQADTIFAGFGGGSVTGIVFGSTGETVILMHDAQPVEIDIKTKQVLREFEKVPNYTEGGGHFLYLKEKGWLIDFARSTELNGMKNFVGQVFWDVTTGKIIMAKQIQNILSDGINCFSFITINDKEYICKLDINTFKYTDSVKFEQGWYHGVQQRFSAGFGIIPNSNKVLIGANISGTRATLYVLDFDTKKYTEIPIPFDNDQKSSTIQRITVSETGKYFVVTMDVANDLTAYLFYDMDFDFVFKETRKHLTEQYNSPDRFVDAWLPKFITDDYLISWKDVYNAKTKATDSYCDFYSVVDKSIKKEILFARGDWIDYLDNNIIIGNAYGIIGLLKFDALPVEDLPKALNPEIKYSNNQLECYSDRAFVGDAQIYDISGKLIANFDSQVFTISKNIIEVNQTLPKGIYILTIQNGIEQISKKFLVE